MSDTTSEYGTFSLGNLCVTEPGTAKILSIAPIESVGNAEISDYSVFDFGQLNGYAGAELKRLKDSKQFRGTKEVSELCSNDGGVESTLAIEVRNSGSTDVSIRGLRINYESGGEKRHLDTRYLLGLCRSEDACV